MIYTIVSLLRAYTCLKYQYKDRQIILIMPTFHHFFSAKEKIPMKRWLNKKM